MECFKQMIYNLYHNIIQIFKNKFAYSRYNREQLQKDLYSCYLKERNVNDKLYNVIHKGAYYGLYDVKKYKIKECVPYAIMYSKLVKKYVPNIDTKYPDNINPIYEQFKEDILYSN